MFATNRQPFTVVHALAVLSLCAQVALAHGEETIDLLQESRAITEEFGERLKTELTRAMAAGGPETAITVCKDVAPGIAYELSRRSGAAVSRTSLRVRNPGNTPDPWQLSVLKSFETMASRQGVAAPLEHFEDHPEEQSIRARYMKGIRIGPLCLACHGETLSDPVRAALDEHYPYDNATGYQLNDVRGAFGVVWPSPQEDE